jgi:sugar phosphate permease
MAEWTTTHERGRVMGVWATCYQVGGIAATGFATWLLGRYGWRAAFTGPAVVLAIVGVLVFVLLRPGPRPPTKVIASADVADAKLTSAEPLETDASARAALLRSPSIYCYGVSYFFIKLIRYSILFWLPFYLETVLKYDATRAGYLSTSFEIGGIAGTIGLGFLSDQFRGLSRPMWSLVSLFCLAGALVLYGRLSGASAGVNFAGMALVGALLYGPDALLSGAAAQDAGGPRAAALAAGLVNGIGSLGAILQEFVTRYVSKRFGWESLFGAFMLFALFAGVSLVPAIWLSHAERAKSPA